MGRTLRNLQRVVLYQDDPETLLALWEHRPWKPDRTQRNSDPLLAATAPPYGIKPFQSCAVYPYQTLRLLANPNN